MDVKNLDSVSREKQKAILNNVIFRCMIENHMTLEIWTKHVRLYEKFIERMQ